MIKEEEKKRERERKKKIDSRKGLKGLKFHT